MAFLPRKSREDVIAFDRLLIQPRRCDRPIEYQMHCTGGDTKGQPTQTNSISHGSPYTLIRKVMVGAAFD